MTKKDSGMVIAWFIGGAAVGAGAALLLAPSSGEETRRKLIGQAAKGRDALTASSQDVIDKGRELYERGRELAEEAADLFEKGRSIAEKKLDSTV